MEHNKDYGMRRWEARQRLAAKHGRRGRLIIGAFLLAVGLLLLARVSNWVIFPWWLFTWQSGLIALGLIVAIKHRFRGGFWALMILIGGFSLADKIDPSLGAGRYLWPVVLMVAGLIFMLKPKRQTWSEWGGQCGGPSRAGATETGTIPVDTSTIDRRDFVDVTSVLGGVKKHVITKTFKGGDIVAFMGGSEIDLSQSDFNGTVRIDTTNVFGGTKLVVPSSWDVQSEVTAVFGGVDDKREVKGVQIDPNKVLILDGTCLFGGIEIRSF